MDYIHYNEKLRSRPVMVVENKGNISVAKIKWLDIFETGIAFIDDDHKRLVGILQDIKNAHDGKDIQGCRTATGIFLDEAKAHFHREEKYLQVISYPSLAAHAREHRKLIELVVELLARMQPDSETGTEPNLDEGLIEDTLYVLLEDIIKADAEFKSLDD